MMVRQRQALAELTLQLGGALPGSLDVEARAEDLQAQVIRFVDHQRGFVAHQHRRPATRRRRVQLGITITQGLGEYFEIPAEEMYGEPFGIPTPDELIFISWFTGGKCFAAGPRGIAAMAGCFISGPVTKPTRPTIIRRCSRSLPMRCIGRGLR